MSIRTNGVYVRSAAAAAPRTCGNMSGLYSTNALRMTVCQMSICRMRTMSRYGTIDAAQHEARHARMENGLAARTRL